MIEPPTWLPIAAGTIPAATAAAEPEDDPPGVRAGSVTDPYSAERLVKSNDAQVICIGARVVGVEVAKLLVDHFLASEFAGGESTRKVAKLAALDTPAGPTGPAS